MGAHMKHDTLANAGHLSSLTAAGSGVTGWLTENSATISLTIAALSFCMAMVFYVANYRLNRKRLALMEEQTRIVRARHEAAMAEKEEHW